MYRILVSYRAIPQSPGWATGDMLVKAFRNLGHECVPYAKHYMENKWIEDPQKILEDSYDLYLQLECGDGDVYYNELHNVKAKKRVSWWFDAAIYPDRWIRETSLISSEINFIANRNLIYDQSNTYYLPYGVDKQLHFRPLDFPKKYDITLVGSDRPERRQLIDFLKKSGLDAHLISGVYREEYIDMLAASKIVVNDIAGGGAGLLAMRYFEAPAAGAYLMTVNDKVGEHQLDLSHKVGHYSSLDNLSFMCRNILRLPNFLKESCDKQQKCVLENHTYEKRAEEILRVIFPNEMV